MIERDEHKHRKNSKDYYELGINELDSGNIKKAIQSFKKARFIMDKSF